jgi:hypothetical protein
LTTGPDDERRPPEPTFADVMNAFSFDSGRSSRSRRWGRRRKDSDQDVESNRDNGPDSAGYGSYYDPYGGHYGDPYGDPYGGQYGGEYGGGYGAEQAGQHRGPHGDQYGADQVERYGAGQHGDRFDAGHEVDPRYPEGGGSAQVRPYAWTRGRTRSGFALEIETLVTTSPRGREQLGMLQYEHRQVAELCDQVRSVAEVAALLGVPLGVAKVLVGDMAGLGLLVVHQTVSGNGDVPDLALMERVLSGLRRL